MARGKRPGGVQKEERLRRELHCLGMTRPEQHTVFVEDAREAAAFDPEEYFDTDAALLKRTFNRPRRGDVGHLAAAAGDPAHASKVSMCAPAPHLPACLPTSVDGCSANVKLAAVTVRGNPVRACECVRMRHHLDTRLHCMCARMRLWQSRFESPYHQGAKELQRRDPVDPG